MVTAPWLSVVGIGEDGIDGLSASARTLVANAQVLAGGRRHLDMLTGGEAQRLVWQSPFADNLPRLDALRGRRVCVLASGDPMWFGIGATLAGRYPADEVTVVPHPGAFSLAAARLGWPLQDTRCLSIHGRPLDALARQLYPGARWLLLAGHGGSAAGLAAWLAARGYGTSRITVLERLGGPAERIVTGTGQSFDDLNTIAVELAADPGTAPLATVPGLPDDAFHHDGQMTKREVRAVTLAALGPWPGALLWDMGAGCGSIAIEWARAGGRAVAVEKSPARADLIARNAVELGVPELTVITGEARASLDGLGEPPDAVFVGGALAPLLDPCWTRLKSGGRLVANAVTAEGEATLLAWQAANGGALSRLAVSRLAATGRFHTWHPLMPVTQYQSRKP